MTVGQRIELKRKEHGLSMEALGEMLGVGRSAVNKWEKGYVQRISRPMIIKMANIFDCDPAWLGGYTDEERKIVDVYAYLDETIIDNEEIPKADKEEMAEAIKRYQKYKTLSSEIQQKIDFLLSGNLSDF